MGPGFHSALRGGLTPIASWLDTLRKGPSAALVFVYRHPAGEAERFVDIACEGCNSMPVCIAGVSDHAILQWGSTFLVSLPFRPLLLPISPESTQLSNNRFALIKVHWLRMVKSPESKNDFRVSKLHFVSVSSHLFLFFASAETLMQVLPKKSVMLMSCISSWSPSLSLKGLSVGRIYFLSLFK